MSIQFARLVYVLTKDEHCVSIFFPLEVGSVNLNSKRHPSSGNSKEMKTKILLQHSWRAYILIAFTVGVMVDKRLQRWINVTPTLGERLVMGGVMREFTLSNCIYYYMIPVRICMVDFLLAM